jgi:histidyl-tRNA synthetase
LDKRGKVGFEDIGAMLIEKGFNTDQVSLIFEILNIKDLDEVKKQLSAESIGVRQMESFLNYVESFGIGDFIKFDISVVRGLSYYTGIVFECFDKESKFRAIFGGGRYDNLFSNLGGINLPAVGFGFGDVVISEVLEHFGLGETPPKDLDYVVCYTSEELENKAIEVSNKLREKGNVLLLYGPERLKKALQTAVKMGARNIAILDPRECSEGKYLIKDLSTEKQEEIDL